MELDSTNMSIFLDQFKPLIHRTLQKINITPQHMDYEDYYQELQIKLLEILQKFKNDTIDINEKNSKFTAYAGQGLYWHAIDLSRMKNNHSLNTIESDKIQWLAEQDSTEYESKEANIYTDDFFYLARERLTEKDYQLLIQLAENRYTMQELADEYGVVRATVYHWKNKIKMRLQDLQDCLLN